MLFNSKQTKNCEKGQDSNKEQEQGGAQSQGAGLIIRYIYLSIKHTNQS